MASSGAQERTLKAARRRTKGEAQFSNPASTFRVILSLAAVLGLIVFCASAAVLVLEILAARLLAPYVGVTLETYTGIIGTVLAGIALGAWYGGRLADRFEPRRLLGPMLLLGGVLALVIVPVTTLLGAARTATGAGGGPVVIGLLTMAGFFAPAAVLSAVTPTVVKVQLRDLAVTGRVVGQLSAIGTTGAIFGTFVTGFILAFVWAPIGAGINTLSNWAITQNPAIGVFIYGLVERSLLPFGLHHIWNAPWFYEFGSYTTPTIGTINVSGVGLSHDSTAHWITKMRELGILSDLWVPSSTKGGGPGGNGVTFSSSARSATGQVSSGASAASPLTPFIFAGERRCAPSFVFRSQPSPPWRSAPGAWTSRTPSRRTPSSWPCSRSPPRTRASRRISRRR